MDSFTLRLVQLYCEEIARSVQECPDDAELLAYYIGNKDDMDSILALRPDPIIPLSTLTQSQHTIVHMALSVTLKSCQSTLDLFVEVN